MHLNKLIKLFLIVKSLFFIRALFKGVAAGTEHLSVLKNLDFDFVVDVGANRGQFALVARDLFIKALIHSFEPLDEPAKIFESIFLSDDKVFLHRCAIGAKKETKTIHVSERDDSSSLLPIGKNQFKLFPHTAESETRTTEVNLLSDILSDITDDSLLKIDVQGFELEVLKGAYLILDKFKYIYVECSFIELYEGQALVSDVIELLSENGFVMKGVYNICYDSKGKAIQADFLFKNKS